MIMDIVLRLGITSNISDQLWKLMRPKNSWGGGDIYPVVFIGLTWFTYGHCVSLMGSILDTAGHSGWRSPNLRSGQVTVLCSREKYFFYGTSLHPGV